MLTHILLRAKKEIDAAPPYRLRNDIQQTNRKLEQTSRSVYAVQAGLGTLGQDLSTVKGKIPQNPAQALVQLGSDIQTVQKQLGALQVKIPQDPQQALAKLGDELTAIRGQLSVVKKKTTDAAQTQTAVAKLTEDLSAISGQVRDVSRREIATSQVQAVLTSQLDQMASDHAQLSNRSLNMDRELALVDQAQRQLLDQTANLVVEVQQLANSIDCKVNGLETRLGQASNRYNLQAKGLCGNLHLVVDSAEDVSAALLNAAATGTFTKELVVQFTAQEIVDEETLNQIHTWANFETVVTPGNTGCWDPTIEWSDDPEADPQFSGGEVRLTATFITDAGLTNVYVVGDTVTVTVKVANDDKFNGWTVAPVVKIYNIIA